MSPRQFKVVVMGEPGSGKSSLIHYLKHGGYDLGYNKSLLRGSKCDIDHRGNTISFIEMCCYRMRNIEETTREYSNADLGIVLIPPDNINGLIATIEYTSRFYQLNIDKPIIFVKSKCDIAGIICNKYTQNDVFLSLNDKAKVQTLLKRVCDELNITENTTKSAGLMIIKLSNELTEDEQKIINAAKLTGAKILTEH